MLLFKFLIIFFLFLAPGCHQHVERTDINKIHTHGPDINLNADSNLWRTLLEEGVDQLREEVSVIGTKNDAATFLAVKSIEFGLNNMLSYLVELGLNLNTTYVQAEEVYSLLDAAVLYNNYQAMEILLGSEVPVNQVSSTSWVNLIIEGKSQVLERLFMQNLTLPPEALKAVWYPIANHDHETLELIISNANPKTDFIELAERQNLILLAVKHRNKTAINALLELGITLDSQLGAAISPLALAILQEDYETIRLLTEHNLKSSKESL